MALSGYLSKCPLTINASQVDNDVTDFPMLLVSSNFPSEIFGSSGGMKSDGSDVRFATDTTGAIEIPREIVNVDKANNVLTVYVKVPSISSSVNTEIYVFWNNINAGEPGDGDPSQNILVWSDWYGILHFANPQTGWKGILDSSRQWSNPSWTTGTITTEDGHAPGIQAVELNVTDGMSLPEPIEMLQSASSGGFIMSFWATFRPADGFATGTFMLGQNGVPVAWTSSNRLQFGYSAVSGPGGASPDPVGTWRFYHVRILSDISFYIDGLIANGFGSSLSPLNIMANLGGNTGCPTFLISGVRFTRNTLSAINQIPVRYDNESNPGAFVTTGTPEVISVQASVTITGIIPDSEVRVYLGTPDDPFSAVELAGQESVITGTFQFNHSNSGSDVYIVIHKENYENLLLELTLPAGDTNIPIFQRFDRTYLNP